MTQSVYMGLQQNMTLLEDEDKTVEELSIEDGNQILIEGQYFLQNSVATVYCHWQWVSDLN